MTEAQRRTLSELLLSLIAGMIGGLISSTLVGWWIVHVYH